MQGEAIASVIAGDDFETIRRQLEGLPARAAARAILRKACTEARASAMQRLEALHRVQPPVATASADVLHYEQLELGSFVRAVVNQLGKPMRHAEVSRIEHDASRRLDPIVQAYLGGSASLERTEFALKEAVAAMRAEGLPNRPRCVSEKDANGRTCAVWYAERVPPSSGVVTGSAAR